MTMLLLERLSRQDLPFVEAGAEEESQINNSFQQAVTEVIAMTGSRHDESWLPSSLRITLLQKGLGTEYCDEEMLDEGDRNTA